MLHTQPVETIYKIASYLPTKELTILATLLPIFYKNGTWHNKAYKLKYEQHFPTFLMRSVTMIKLIG